MSTRDEPSTVAVVDRARAHAGVRLHDDGRRASGRGARATWSATQRTPLPHISGTEPSALMTRMRTSHPARARRQDEEHAVGAHAEAPVAEARRACADESHRLVGGLDEDEVVAEPLVLVEA